MIFLWKYKVEIVIILICGYLWYIFNDRSNLKQEVSALQEEALSIRKQVTLNGDINEAIQKIRITSNNNITAIVKETKPVLTNQPMVLISGGVQGSVYKTYSANGGTSTSK